MADEHQFLWNDDMSVHSDELDNQHKHLIEIIDELSQASSNGELEGVLGSILDKLSQYILYHFTMEEVYFDIINFYDKENHKKEHQIFRDKIEDFKMKYKSNIDCLSGEIIVFMRNWLFNHIRISDQKYAEFLQRKGINSL